MILYRSSLPTYYHLVLVVGGWSSRKWEIFQKRCGFHRSATIVIENLFCVLEKISRKSKLEFRIKYNNLVRSQHSLEGFCSPCILDDDDDDDDVFIKHPGLPYGYAMRLQNKSPAAAVTG